MTHVLEVELGCQLKHYCVSESAIWFEVDEFYQFIHELYRAYASISRRSEPITMRNRIICFAKGVKFFVWVADGGLRYCCA